MSAPHPLNQAVIAQALYDLRNGQLRRGRPKNTTMTVSAGAAKSQPGCAKRAAINIAVAFQLPM